MSFPTVSLNQQQPLSCHHFSEEKIQYSKIIVYWGPSHLFIFIHFPPCTPENAGPLCHTIAVKFHLSVKFPPGWHLRQTEIWAIWLLKNYGSKLYKLLWLVKISLSLSICNTWMDLLWILWWIQLFLPSMRKFCSGWSWNLPPWICPTIVVQL